MGSDVRSFVGTYPVYVRKALLLILLTSVEFFVFEHELPRMTMNFQKLKTMLLASNHTRYGGEEYEET